MLGSLQLRVSRSPLAPGSGRAWLSRVSGAGHLGQGVQGSAGHPAQGTRVREYMAAIPCDRVPPPILAAYVDLNLKILTGTGIISASGTNMFDRRADSSPDRAGSQALSQVGCPPAGTCRICSCAWPHPACSLCPQGPPGLAPGADCLPDQPAGPGPLAGTLAACQHPPLPVMCLAQAYLWASLPLPAGKLYARRLPATWVCAGGPVACMQVLSASCHCRQSMRVQDGDEGSGRPGVYSPEALSARREVGGQGQGAGQANGHAAEPLSRRSAEGPAGGGQVGLVCASLLLGWAS